jgi:hypothetical protein
VRVCELRPPARGAFQLLGPAERKAVSAVIAEMMDERVPLVGPSDAAVTHGSSIMGRRVRGTSLVVYYVPAGDGFFVVNVIRR